LDGNPATGWGVDPEEGMAHEAIFEAREPAGFAGGTELVFTLEQATPAQHTLGRFRLAATAAQPPLAVKADPARRSRWGVKGQAPACSGGGTLAVIVELTMNGRPYAYDDARTQMKCRGVLAGREVSGQPVLSCPSDKPASWQGWRIRVEPSATPQPFALKIAARVPADVKAAFVGHFIPAADP